MKKDIFTFLIAITAILLFIIVSGTISRKNDEKPYARYLKSNELFESTISDFSNPRYNFFVVNDTIIIPRCSSASFDLEQIQVGDSLMVSMSVGELTLFRNNVKILECDDITY